MASSLTPTSFNIKITEEQIVRNSIIKHEITHEIQDISNVDHRILTCPENTYTNIIEINPTNPGAGAFPSGSLQYIRISNLDEENKIFIILSGSQSNFTTEISPKNTLFLSSPDITGSNFNGVLTDSINTIQMYSPTSSIDVEYTVVNS